MAEFWSNNDRSYYLRLWVDQVSQNISDNSSQVRVRLALTNGAHTFSDYDCSASVTVDGQTLSWSGRPSMLSQNSSIMLIDRTVTIRHENDGKKTFSLSATFSGGGGWSPGTLTLSSNSFTLTTIPRSSSVRVGAGVIGNTVTININRQNPSFKHTVRYSWAGKSGTIASNVDTSATWSIPIDFANDIPNSASGTGTIFVDTYSGTTKTGTQSTTFTASVPANVKPTFTGVTLSDLNGAAQNLISNSDTFIQVISNIKVAFNGAKGTYGSSITGYRAEIVGKNQATNSNGGSLGIMNYNGTIKIRASVSDSRGRWSDTREVSVTVLEYFAPALSFSIARTGSTSSTLTATRNAKIAPLTVAGRQKNTMTLTFKVARLGTNAFAVDNGQATGTWSSISSLVNSQANLAGNYLANQSWVVIGTLEDKFTRTEFMVNVATESVVFSYDRSGVGVNKIRERGALDVKGNIFANDQPIQQYQLTTNDRAPLRFDDKPNVTNANLLDAPGQYYIDRTARGNPNGQWGYLFHYSNYGKNTDGYKEAIQLFYGNNGQVYFRHHRWSRTIDDWEPWKEYASKADIPQLPPKDKIITTDDIPKLFNGTSWQNLPLQNGWKNHPDYSIVQYSKTFDGIVYLRGSATGGKTTLDTVIGTLPVGFRPTQSMYLTTINNAYNVAVLCVLPDGRVVIKGNVDSTWLSLDNISFRI
jgi:orf22|nr:MAG TPA: protein of unknown function DUF859 [Caudoviricetes sp.]